MATIVPLRSGHYRAQIRRKGYPRLGKVFETEAEARAWATRTESQMLRPDRDGVVRQPGGITVSALVDMYTAGGDHQDKAPSTQAREKRSLAQVVAALGEAEADGLTHHVIQLWLDKRRPNVSPDSLRLERLALRAVLDYGLQRGLCRNTVMHAKFRTPRGVEREVRIPPDVEHRLRVEAERVCKRTGDRTLIQWLDLCFETGMRPGEAAKIEWSWLRLEEGKALIPRRGQKNRSPRLVLLSEHLCEALAKRERSGPYVLSSSGGNTPFAYSHAFKRLAAKIERPELVPHAIRHEWISRMFELTDLPESKIAELAGDTHPVSLLRYRHLRADRLREQLETAQSEMRRLRTVAILEAAVQAAEAGQEAPKPKKCMPWLTREST